MMLCFFIIMFFFYVHFNFMSSGSSDFLKHWSSCYLNYGNSQSVVPVHIKGKTEGDLLCLSIHVLTNYIMSLNDRKGRQLLSGYHFTFSIFLDEFFVLPVLKERLNNHIN